MRYGLGPAASFARASSVLRYRGSNSDQDSRRNGSNKSSKWKSQAATSRAGLGDILRDPRYRAEVASSKQRTYTNGRTSITEEAVLLRAFNPDSCSCITLHTLLRPRYICHLASSRPLETRIGPFPILFARSTIDRAV